MKETSLIMSALTVNRISGCNMSLSCLPTSFASWCCVVTVIVQLGENT